MNSLQLGLLFLWRWSTPGPVPSGLKFLTVGFERHQSRIPVLRMPAASAGAPEERWHPGWVAVWGRTTRRCGSGRARAPWLLPDGTRPQSRCQNVLSGSGWLAPRDEVGRLSDSVGLRQPAFRCCCCSHERC